MASTQSAVLVTGASTGIGHATTLQLAREGNVVFAGVRSPEDARRLQAEHPNIAPVTLDVRNAADIDAAAQTVAARGLPLRGVVNNAGIAVAGPLEYLSLDDLRRQFEVNVFGAIAVTQAMLPLLRAGNGRVVFVSSVSGQIAPPYIGPYAASKFALEALADSLRMELSQFEIPVIVVQPGNVKTPIWQKGRDAKAAMVGRMSPKAIEHYGDVVESLSRLTEHEEQTGIDPSVVAAAISRALSAKTPRARYAVGNPPAWQRRMAALLPERFRDRLILKNFKRA